MKSRKRILLSLIIAMMMMLSLVMLTSCGGKIVIRKSADLMTEPYDYLQKDSNNVKLVAKNPIDWVKDDPKKIIEKTWDNMRYAPFYLLKQTGDVSTVTLGMTVIQSVSTYRMAIRKPTGDPNERADDEKPGATQSINYMQSYSVTAQGVAGVDIRLMCESLRMPDGKYIYRQATDATNIKLDPESGAFYNLSGKWDIRKSDGLASFNANSNKDNPNNILAYKLTEENIAYAYIVEVEAAEQTSDLKFYRVQMKAAEGAYKDYIDIMNDMLALGGQSGEIKYNDLTMTFDIWENGFIKRINFGESYDLKIGPLNANASLKSELQITYKDRQELKDPDTEKITNTNWKRMFLNKTGKNFSNARKPKPGVDVGTLK